MPIRLHKNGKKHSIMMRLRSILVLVFTVAMMSLCGCGSKEPEEHPFAWKRAQEGADSNTSVVTNPVTGENETSEDAQDETGLISIDGNIFPYLSQYTFFFTDGSGEWGTDLHILSDGSFYGMTYYPGGDEAGRSYPNGKVFYSSFYGQFGEIRKGADDIYTTKVMELNLDKEPDTEEYADGYLYVYSQPYGISNLDDICFFMPGKWVDGLPSAFVSWVRAAGALTDKESGLEYTELPFIGLYNATEQYGFYSRTLFDTDVPEDETGF